MDFFKHIIIVAACVGLLTGCGTSVEEKIYNHLEKAVSLESVFEEQQEPLVKLEKKEQKLYEKIIQLGMSEFEEIKTLSQDAIAVVDEREARMEKERKSILASKQEFLLINPMVENLKDKKAKENAEQLINTMNKRYDSYTKLNQYYQDAIKLDRELYKMFQKEDLSLKELEEQVKKINGMYNNVINEDNKFNELTDTYNKAKREFYEVAGLHVTFKSNEASKGTTK